MASNVTVLLPDGKRQVIKTTPAMSLKSVVNTVCEKHKIPDPESYGLKTGRTTLDLSLSIRFANLPQGAKLELVKCGRPKPGLSQISIALQLEEGGRLMDKFPNATTIWEILESFEKRSNGTLNLTRREAKPKEDKSFFKALTSKDKLLYIIPAVLLLDKEYSTILDLKSKTLEDVGLSSGNALMRVIFKFTDKTLEEMMPEITNPGPVRTRVSEVTKKEVVESNSSTHKVSPPQQIQEKNASAQSTPSLAPSQQRALNQTSQTSIPENIDSKSHYPTVTSVISPVIPSSQAHISASSPQPQAAPSDVISRETAQPEIVGSLDRDMKLFLPPVEGSDPFSNRFNLPESFYNVTKQELKIMIESQKNRRQQEENAPLKTLAMRKREEEGRMSRYPKTMIRIRFPDRYQLQVTFWTTETVGALYEFVAAQLTVKDKEFYLYTTPPLTKLTDLSASFWTAKLTPASVVYFSFTDHNLPIVPTTELLLSDVVTSAKELPVEQPPVVVGSTAVPMDEDIMESQDMQEDLEKEREKERAIVAQQTIDKKKQSDQQSKMLPKWMKLSKK
ncbi:ubiquitin-related domain-containing protein [Paraphysoderma sedebokerense]|nr:ubiquitin-related domain-containing protein [Paraphysoderma sedebokerense]